MNKNGVIHYVENPIYTRIREHLGRHNGHEIVVAGYGGKGQEPWNMSIECETCNCVIMDADKFMEDEADATGEMGMLTNKERRV